MNDCFRQLCYNLTCWLRWDDQLVALCVAFRQIISTKLEPQERVRLVQIKR